MKKKKLYIKRVILFFLALLLISTLIFCVSKPKMHKPLQLNVIEYFLKINSDGTATTTKQVTTTGIREQK